VLIGVLFIGRRIAAPMATGMGIVFGKSRSPIIASCESRPTE
jgi:hypothetical protein